MTEAKEAQRTAHEAEEHLLEFQQGLQRRLRSGLRTNTLILAGAAMISVAFAFNSMVILESAFDAAAMDALISEIQTQTALLENKTDTVVEGMTILGGRVDEHTSRLRALGAEGGALRAVSADSERLAKSLRRGRVEGQKAREALWSVAANAGDLAEDLESELARLEAASGDEGELSAIRVRAGNLSAYVQGELEKIEASPLSGVSEQAASLAAEIDSERQQLSTWREGEVSVEQLREQSAALAAQLRAERAKVAELERVNTELMARDAAKIAQQLALHANGEDGLTRNLAGLAQETRALSAALARQRRQIKRAERAGATSAARDLGDAGEGVEVPASAGVTTTTATATDIITPPGGGR